MRNVIDITYRIDPKGPASRRTGMSAAQVRRRLERGNTDFSALIASIQAGKAQSRVTPISFEDLGIGDGMECAVQAPYAAVLACSDARVPTEMVFQQGFNDLFVVRVAGNVLGNECLGSFRYAVTHFPDTLRVLAVLGHANCGAVTAAVDAFLTPRKYLDAAGNYPLRTIIDQILVSARTADMALQEVHGQPVVKEPGYRQALVRVTVAVNAAWNAFSLRRELAGHTLKAVEVVFGVYDLGSHSLALMPTASGLVSRSGFFEPPANAKEFRVLVTKLSDAALPAR